MVWTMCILTNIQEPLQSSCHVEKMGTSNDQYAYLYAHIDSCTIFMSVLNHSLCLHSYNLGLRCANLSYIYLNNNCLMSSGNITKK